LSVFPLTPTTTNAPLTTLLPPDPVFVAPTTLIVQAPIRDTQSDDTPETAADVVIVPHPVAAPLTNPAHRTLAQL
jgi:hypothetical protein